MKKKSFEYFNKTVLAESYVNLKIDLLPSRFEGIERELIELSISSAQKYFDFDFETYNRIEEGSFKKWLAIAGGIYIAIGQYGSFRAGVSQIVEDTKMLTEIINSQIIEVTGANERDVVKKERRTAIPGALSRVISSIESVESFTNSEIIKDRVNSILVNIPSYEDRKYVVSNLTDFVEENETNEHPNRKPYEDIKNHMIDLRRRRYEPKSHAYSYVRVGSTIDPEKGSKITRIGKSLSVVRYKSKNQN